MSDDKQPDVTKDVVYYDESCYVCSFEISILRKRGEACGIEFINISSADFDNRGRDYDSEMVGEFDQKETIGIETLRKLYEKIGFKRTVWLSRIPVIRHVLNAGYWVFAHWVRPYLPKRKSSNNS